MSRFRFPTLVILALAILLGVIAPSAFGHGGGHGGGGHGGFGHGGFGYGGYHGYGYGGYHGFGYGGYGFHGGGYGYRGFGWGYPGFGYPGLGGWGYGLGGFGYGLYGFGGLGYGALGYGGLGYGGLGYGGLGFGGLGYRGFGYGGFGYGDYGGLSSGCSCCCLSATPLYAGSAYPLYGGSPLYSPYNGGSPPVIGGGDPLPMPRGVSSSSRYMDYYARNAKPSAPTALASNRSTTRYEDYYARNARPAAKNKALLHVSVPADAELWLNGKLMTRTGTERDFLSPQLEEGETYAYQIKARWTQDGRSQEETMEVKVRANKTTNVRMGASSLAKR